MQQLLKTLYITEEMQIKPSVEAMEIIRTNNERKIRIPYHMIESMCIFGKTNIEDAVLSKCMQYGIGIYVLTQNGKFRYSIQGPTRGNVLLRKRQYLLSESCERLKIATEIIRAKIKNGYMVLQRFQRNHPEINFTDTIQKLKKVLEGVSLCTTVDELRGKEGEAARIYFSVFDQMILVRNPEMRFRARSKRPPEDRCNALLSFVYTLLTTECIHALECKGMDPYVGFIHGDRPGKPSLALDLMEELRPMIADRFVIKLINRKIISLDMFEERGDGVYLNSEGKTIVLREWAQMKNKEIIYFEKDEKIPRGLVPYVQASVLSSVLRGEKEAYKAYDWR